MLKRFLFGTFLVACLCFGAQAVQAVDLTTGLPDAAGTTGAGYDTGQNLPTVIGLIIKGVLGFMGVIFLVLVIFAGLTWMTSGGDAKKVEKAKGILVTAVIGLIIVLAAYSITAFVFSNIAISTTDY